MKTNNIILRPLRRMTIQERIDDGMYNATDFLNQWNDLYPHKAITFDEFIEKESVFEESFGEDFHLSERYIKEEDGIWMEPFLFNSLLITIDEDLWVELEMEKAEDKGRKQLELLLHDRGQKRDNEYKYTYILTDKSGKYKIGRTSDIKKRFSTFCVSNPSIKIIAIIIGDAEEELHRRFRNKQVKGEWFDLSAFDIKYILNKYKTINA